MNKDQYSPYIYDHFISLMSVARVQFIFLSHLSHGFCFSQEEMNQNEKFYVVKYIFAAPNYSVMNNRPEATAKVGYNFVLVGI